MINGGQFDNMTMIKTVDNDLKTWCIENNRLDLLDEWDNCSNTDYKPELIAKASGKKVWWTCKYGHKWETTVRNRTMLNTGCPDCDGKKIKSQAYEC